MMFKNNIGIFKPKSISFNFNNLKIPNNTDIYYTSKKDELLNQYYGARNFLHETQLSDWEHHLGSQKNDKVFQLMMKGHFYEASLIFYNIVVDLSWALSYSSLEFACTSQKQRVSVNGYSSIDEAYDLLRKVEKSTTNPTADDNPFDYLRMLNPEYSPIVDYIISFWENFRNTPIRTKYNFCKHRGKPLYTELDAIYKPRLFNVFFIDENNNQTQLPSCVADVQYKFSLNDSIDELIKFDDEVLFPYLKELFAQIENLINLSPMAM